MALLSLDGVTKKFGEVVVADNITFQLNEGESLGIVGPNGAGKTSLFGIISGDLKPEKGSITLEGVNLLALSTWSRTHAGVGRTYQVPRPFEHMTTFENVLVAAQQGARLRGQSAYDAAYAALLTTGLANFSDRPAANLGLMHRKRLELARALAGRPRALLLDEIAGGLTDLEVNELTGIVAGLQRDGIAVIWIEHVVRALVSTVSRLICLANGSIVADGRPDEVLASEEVRSVYLGSGFSGTGERATR
ncbi:MAG TPA: ATP-binding cassette domain-containing protein [Acidimicrobiales bacterium]|nr:ATP-binding cassette domain-containing protein [Acidimicrobiales bacterium]